MSQQGKFPFLYTQQPYSQQSYTRQPDTQPNVGYFNNTTSMSTNTEFAPEDDEEKEEEKSDFFQLDSSDEEKERKLIEICSIDIFAHIFVYLFNSLEKRDEIKDTYEKDKNGDLAGFFESLAYDLDHKANCRFRRYGLTISTDIKNQVYRLVDQFFNDNKLVELSCTYLQDYQHDVNFELDHFVQYIYEKFNPVPFYKWIFALFCGN